MLREMRGRRGLAAAALEVDDCDHLQMLVSAPPGNVTAVRAAFLVEIGPQFLNLLGGVRASAACRRERDRTFTFERKISEITALHAEKFCRLAGVERAQRLFRGRREKGQTMR